MVGGHAVKSVKAPILCLCVLGFVRGGVLGRAPSGHESSQKGPDNQDSYHVVDVGDGRPEGDYLSFWSTSQGVPKAFLVERRNGGGNGPPPSRWGRTSTVHRPPAPTIRGVRLRGLTWYL